MAKFIDITGRISDTVRHWYVCGSDRGLALAAVQEIREQAGQHTSRVEYVDAGLVEESVIHGLMLGAGTLPGERPALVVVENAELHDFSWLLDEAPADLPAWF